MRKQRPHITTTYDWVRELSSHSATYAVVNRGGRPVIHWRF